MYDFEGSIPHMLSQLNPTKAPSKAVTAPMHHVVQIGSADDINTNTL